ncbi:MAG TPA: PAS domain S-box protein, partial [Burkholderiaceae bacterium]
MSAPARPAPADPPFKRALNGAIHAALEAIVTVDDRQRIVMINPAAQRMFGCTAAEALGSDLSRFIPLRLRAAHARHVRAFDASETAALPLEKRSTVVGLRADGTEFPVEASISRVDVESEFGPRRYFTALLRDLSEEQGLQAEIEAMKQRMRAVFELAPVAIWITEGDHIVFANRACAALFGAADHTALIGWSIYSLLRPQSHAAVRQRVTQALASDGPVPMVNERIVRFDGTEREVVIAVAGLPDHGRTTLQMVISDITERSRESQDLERSRRELRRLSANLVDAREEERRRIARELHDELGQRLTALKMELASLATQTPGGTSRERIASMLEMVDETVASVRRIATDLRPLMLDDLGLNAAIEWLADGWARRMG